MMNILEPIVLGLVLCADSFSAAVALGFKPHTFKDSLKFAISSGSAEAMVTFAGAFTGEKVISKFSFIDHWIAFILLMLVSAHMLYEGILEFRNTNSHTNSKKNLSIAKILIVSFATSVDALAVGVSLGVSGKSLLPYLISIGGFAFLSTIIGMAIARRVPKHLSAIFNILGALILFILACDMLFL